MAPSLALVPSDGANDIDVDMLVTHIERDEVMRMQGFVKKANGWVDRSGLFNHRFVLLTVEHRSREGVAPWIYYIRVDRRPERQATVLGLSLGRGRARSSDRVMLSYDQDQLLPLSNRKESALVLGQPLRLDALGLMLRAIRREFADYKLTKENCWAMTSVILEMLEREGRGSYIQGRLCYPEWAPEVRERVRNTLRATLFTVTTHDVTIPGSDAERQSIVPHVADVSIIPPPPLHLFGRDEYVRRIVDLITSKVSARLGARLVIGGPGGIGKTSVALKIFHLPELDALIPPQARFFVRCQAVTTASTFLSAIASTLGVEMAEDNPLESVLRRLRAERGPMMLVLDNAESFWMNSEVQPHARAILRHACNIVPLTLLITIRGTEQPDVAIWDPLPLLGPLRLDDARKAFFAIANTVQPSASLDLLLKKVDYVPLAVNLLARRCQISGENPIALSNRWERERTELLQLGGRSPEDNIDISIKLSLDLELMQKNPVALRLLSIVSHLPAGIPDEACNSLELPEPELSAAEFLLRRLSLTYSPAPGWLTTLEPVRAYVRRWHHPSPDHLRAVEDWHIALATSHGNYEPGDAEFQSASATLALHSANISFVLHARIRRRDNLPYLANAVLAFSNFLSCTLPDADLLASLLSVGGDELDGLPHSQCTQLLGNILLTRGEYEEAQLKLEEARSQYINIHDPLAAAQCLSSLGDIARMRDQYNDARSKLEEAQEIFTNIGDRVGIAQCLRGLGHTLLMQGWYVEAQLKLKEAHLEFINIGDPLGAAQCLQCLGDVSLTLCQYKDARSKLEEAHLAFIGLNNWNGAAQCLQSLSDLSFREGHYKDARSKLDEAHSKFVSVGSRHWAAQCLQSLGTLLCAQCQFGPARAKLKEALMEFRSTNAQLGQAKCLQSLGNLLLLQGRYGEARSGLEEAQSKFTEVGDRHGVAQCRRSLANILKAERPHDEAARAKLEEVRVEFINLGDRLGITECLRCLGDISLTQGRYDDARSKLEEALSHFSSIGYRLGVAQCLRGLGDVFRLQGHHADARSTLEDARSIFISLEDQLGTARCLRSLSIVLQAQGHCEDARSMLEDAKSRFISIGLRAEAAGTDRILCRDVTPRPYVNT